MQVNANWCVRTLALSAVLAFVFMALSCGGGGTSNIGLTDTPTYSGGNNSSDAVRGTGVVVHETEIASLPRWQQELLSDPGWNQPYIEPTADTEIGGPSTEMLLRLTREKLEANITVTPRGFSPAGKSASWNGIGATSPTLVRGEYDGVARDATPPFGCNSNGGNGDGDNGIEDLIAAYVVPITPVSYVTSDGYDLGWARPNYFCDGGAGNDMFSAVYQLFADDPASDPTEIGTEWLELSYNAGLLGAPVGPGGVCTAEAFSVSDSIWRRFNADLDATPNMNATELYNVLIAPAGNVEGPVTTSGGSVAYYQPFFFGSVGTCYGGAQIVSIASTESDCDVFADIFNNPETAPVAQDFFTNPVYGLLLRRWQEMSEDGTPWATTFGMPVFGPFAYSGGAPVLTGKGQYYAWGMWYERGFMWWIDYDNDGVSAPYPNATDEAQAYVFTGTNVYCDEDADYIQLPTVFYGGQGSLGVSISVQAQRETGADDWGPVEFTGTQYNIPLGSGGGEAGLDTMTLSLFAQGNGGTADVDCNYKYYVWALRNGSIISAGAPFDPDQRFVNGTYGSDIENRESIYVVRVQVTDADDSIAYGDSFPIHVGHNDGPTGGGFEPITIVNNDLNGDWPANLQAITDDLDELQVTLPDLRYGVVEFYEGIGDDIFDAEVKMVLWYQGGPVAGSGEPFNQNSYTVPEAEALESFRTNGVPLVNFSQSAGIWDNTTWRGPSYHYLEQNVRQFNSIFDHTLPTGWSTTDFAEGIMGIYDYEGFNWTAGSTCTTVHGDNPGGGNWYFGFGPFQRSLGEGYIGAGSSGASYNGWGYGWLNPSLGQTVRAINTVGEPRNPLDMPGTVRGIGDYGFTFRSWGNIISQSYFIGYAWNDLNVTNGSPFTPTRAQNLQNIMASLDSDIWTYGGAGGGGGGFGGGGAFIDYNGPEPAIVMTKPVFWNDDGTFIEGSATSPGTGMYPDDTGIDVFRSTVGPYNDEIMRTAGNGDEDGLNGNDIDMQAPFYGYWHYGLDGITELGPDGTGDPNDALDDMMWAAGALVNNVDVNADTFDDWRLTAGDPSLFGTPAGSRLVSGYYYNSTMSDPSVDDGHVSAFYGVKPANLAFDGRAGTVSFEAIARWAPTGTLPNGIEAHGAVPARLRWSLFPGHGVVVPDGAAGFPEYGKQLSWKQFMQDHDIANGGVGTFRDDAGFLRPSFSFGGNDSLTDGRILDFDFRSIVGWYTDFNGNFIHGDIPNGVDDPGDKFPYRARLITGWTAYLDNTLNQTAWPNRMPDPTPPGAPVEGIVQPNSFFELGGYIVDTSAGDPGVQIVDDPECDDPIAYNENWPDLYTDLCYEIIGGTAPYDVYLDPAYDLVTYDPLNPFATFDDVLGLGLTWLDLNAGLNSETVTWQDSTGGDRIFALMVIDSTGTNRDMFFYPDTVAVGPPMQVAIINDPLSANSNAYDNMVADIADSYGASVITTFDLAASDLAPNDLDGFDGVIWASDYPITGSSGSGVVNTPEPMGFSYGSGNANLNEVRRFAMAGGTTLIASPVSFRFTFWNNVGNMRDFLAFYYGYFYDGFSPTSERADFINGMQSEPNVMTGLYNYEASRVGPNFNSMMGPPDYRNTDVACVDSYNNSTFWVAGRFREESGGGGYNTQLLCNWGDFSPDQQGGTRAEALQNLLVCAGNNPDPWDPSYVPPEPTTVLYQDDLDGNVTGSATFTAQNNGGTYNDTWGAFDGPTYGFGGGQTNVGGDAYTYCGEVYGHPQNFGNYLYGNNNRKTLYWGPMDFSAETEDPMFWVRYYSDQESSGTSWDRIWFGYSTNATHEWNSGYSSTPPWEHADNPGDSGSKASPGIYELSLTGAAGQTGVYVTTAFSSDGSVDWYDGTWLDNFTVGTYGLPPGDI